MSVHKSFTYSVKTVEVSGSDLAGFGSLLSGIGTLLGAIAVIIAAIVGTGTLRAWKEQQIIQRQMDIAEQIMSIAFRARSAIQSIRSKKEGNQELIKAFEEVDAFGVDIVNNPSAYSSRLQAAFIIIRRVESCSHIWDELELLKARGWAHFDQSVMVSLNTISFQVELLREATEAYFVDPISEENRIKYGIILKDLTLKESLGMPDTVTLALAEAVQTIEDELKPVITSNSKNLSAIASKSFMAAFKSAMSGVI